MMLKRFVLILTALALLAAAILNCVGAGVAAAAGADEAPDGAVADEVLPADAYVLTFDEENKYEGLFDGHLSAIDGIYYDNEKKCRVIAVAENNDPFLELLFGTLAVDGTVEKISADKYKVVQFGVRLDPAAGREGTFYFQTETDSGYAEQRNISYVYKNTDQLQYVTFACDTNPNWKGMLTDCRYDLLSPSRSDVDVELYYVGFFTDEESANAYGAEWLRQAGVEEGSDPGGPQTHEGGEKDMLPKNLFVFDQRAGNISVSAGEALFDGENVSQLTAAYADKSGNCFRLEISPGNDPFAELVFGELFGTKKYPAVACADYKVLQLALKTDTTHTNGAGTLYFQTSDFPGYSEKKNVHYQYEATDGLQFLNIDFSDEALWEGNVANCRFDMFENLTQDGFVDIYYLAFFSCMEAADEFSDKYLTWLDSGGEFPGEIVNLAPAATPTAEPQVTPAPEATAAPTANVTAPASAQPGTTSDAGSNGDNNGSGDGGNNGNGSNGNNGSNGGGGGFPLVPVLVGAGVLAAAVVAVVVLTARKKRGGKQGN